MRTKSIVLAAALLLLLSALAFTYQAQRPRWEFTQTCHANDINKLGGEGWELVAVTSGGGMIDCYYFKRQK
jgi:hypothetical protein